MIIYMPTYGMKCRICGGIVPVGTKIGVDDEGNDFVEHSECRINRDVHEALDAGYKEFCDGLKKLTENPNA